MSEDLLKELEIGIIERLSRVLLSSKDYKQALLEEKTAYEQLTKELTEEQQIMLEEYYNATSKITLLLEKVAYKQGVADLVSLLKRSSGNNTVK